MLILDKPRGPTSHDVVARVRRTLGTKRVGHAGTLDPMASGVLVVLVGEATKLAPFLTAHDKRYEAVVALGIATTTFDAEGAITAEQAIPGWLRAEVEAAVTCGNGEGDDLARSAPHLHAALEAERRRTEQMPPAYSAVKVGGKRSYALARAGEAIDLAARPVSVRALRVPARHTQETDATPGAVAQADATPLLVPLELDVSKGYYVRSLARDLGDHLGVPSHLASLRRTQSGPFTIGQAIALDASPSALRAALTPVAEAAKQSLATALLTEAGAARARDGKRLSPSDFSSPVPESGELSAWLDPLGRLVAIGLVEDSRLVIRRGFAKEEESIDE